MADFLHLDVLFTVPSGDISCVPAWFDTSAGQSTVSASDAAVVLLERMTCVPFKAIEPLDIGRICCDPHDLAALCIGPSKREAFALDQVALEVVAESLGESLPTLVVVCRGLENCTVYIAGVGLSVFGDADNWLPQDRGLSSLKSGGLRGFLHRFRGQLHFRYP